MVKSAPLAFEVTYDGGDPFLIGQEDWSVLTMTLTALNDDRTGEADLNSHLGGLTKPGPDSVSHHFRWKTPTIRVGSTVQVRVVTSDDFLPPTNLFRSDHEVQENPFTDEELRALRYEDYLILKAEFER